jgi:signal transduction histidine kinase
MRDLSLHVLDLVENSVRAGASRIVLTLVEDSRRDRLTIVVEDDGRGMAVDPESAADPFFTTKNGKRTGLGLSLLRAAAERAGGGMEITRSSMGGVAVRAEMQMSHVDRSPLGDLAATLSSVVCTNTELDVTCRLTIDGREQVIRVCEVTGELPNGRQRGLLAARRLSKRIKDALCALEAKT